MNETKRKSKHTALNDIGFSEAKALFRQKLARKCGHAIARGWATLLLDRLRDFAVVLLCGRKLFF
jgi:hypothetical protein